MSNGGDPGNRTLVDKILAKDFRSPLLSPKNRRRYYLLQSGFQLVSNPIDIHSDINSHFM